MVILITGGMGMLGRALTRRLANVIAFSSRDLDVCDVNKCNSVIGLYRPHIVIHCAAMTAVDRCEHDSEAAFRTNAIGSSNVAGACYQYGARLIFISTDYVFSGDLNRPYNEWDKTGARTIYGMSKCAGENAIRVHCPNHLIVRTAWLYGQGGSGFVQYIMKMGSQNGEPLKVVDDQIGNPTSTDAFIDALMPLLNLHVGTVHLTCEGMSSRYDLACAIFNMRGYTRGITRITTAESGQLAPRPLNSCLDKMVLRLYGLPPMQGWKESLQHFITNCEEL